MTTVLLLLLSVCAWTTEARAQRYEKRAPYAAIRWAAEDKAEVKIQKRWYVLRSIDRVDWDLVVAFAKKQHGRQWKKRCNEDLVQVLAEMDKAPGKTVRLELEDLTTRKTRVIGAAAMTEENRRAIWKAGRVPAGRTVPPAPSKATVPGSLTDDLDLFAAALTERWSYRDAQPVGFDAAITALREKVEAGLSADAFGVELQKIIALGIDGHAGVRGYRLPRGKALPFLIEPVGDRFVAFLSDRSKLLAEGLPYLTRIDGKPIASWCKAAGVLVPKGSPQYQRRGALRQLRELDAIRGFLGPPAKPTVQVEVESIDGKRHKQLELDMAARKPLYGTWPRGGSRMLPGDVGYLRLPQMNDKAVLEIREWMPRFRKAKGLVIDVRDNGGGSRNALRQIYSFLASPKSAPRVINAAAYRLHEDNAANHLEPRYMYRADAREWSDAERVAIAEFAKGFRPEWSLPKGKFSAWHYMVLTPKPGAGVYAFDRPVVILMNAKCFSATDIFLAGLKGLPRVTLLGTASGGGSARSQSTRLPYTGLELRIGSMASFQRDGKLFDGRGIAPDRVVHADPGFFVGGKDLQLTAALDHILGR